MKTETRGPVMGGTTKKRHSPFPQRVWLESTGGGPLEGTDGRVVKMSLPEALFSVRNQKNAERRFTLPALTVGRMEELGYTLDRWYVAFTRCGIDQ